MLLVATRPSIEQAVAMFIACAPSAVCQRFVCPLVDIRQASVFVRPAERCFTGSSAEDARSFEQA